MTTSDEERVHAIDLEQIASFDETWVPKVVGELNGQQVKVAKLEGEYVWHAHANEDELFLVLAGRLEIHLRGRVVHLAAGELAIVPRGGGVRDLDRGFGAFADALTQRALGGAALVFTSDHGEAFAEHGVWGHGSELYEDSLRIPLFLAGAGIAPGECRYAASLVDLPHTLAELAGVAPDPEWRGRSLLALDVERPVLAFARHERHGAGLVAAVAGSRKLLLACSADGGAPWSVRAAFDLERDPCEREDRAALDEPWPAELAARLAGELERMRAATLSRESAPLGAAEERELRDLGYLGGD